MREKLISLREERKLTQELVAEMVGISRSFYGHIELGKRNPSFGLAKKIAKIFDCEPEDIFCDLDCFRLKPIQNTAEDKEARFVAKCVRAAVEFWQPPES